MNETKFTKGPWSIEYDQWNSLEQPRDVWACIIAPDPNDAVPWFVANVLCCAESSANASLIAAAPEMYEALDFVSAHLTNDPLAAHERIRAALAKARGEVI